MAQSLLSVPHIIAVVPNFTITHPDLPDVDDNRLLELAVASHADLIVSGDKELLALRQIALSEALRAEPLQIPLRLSPSCRQRTP